MFFFQFVHSQRENTLHSALVVHTYRVYYTRVVLELIASLRNGINYQCKLSAVNDVFVTHNKAIYILLLVRHFIEYHFFLLLLRWCCCCSRCLFVFCTLRSLRHSTRLNNHERQSVTSRAAKEETTTKTHEQRQRQAGDNQKLTQNCSITVNCLT